MKKYLIALILTATLALPSQVAAQKHRHTPVVTPTQVVDSIPQDELEAFSDTTSVDSAYDASSVSDDETQIIIEGDDIVDVIRQMSSDPAFHNTLIGGLTVMGILLILFVLAPLVILSLLFFFIYKNRKQKVRLAEEAMRNGQPIPDQLFDDKKTLPASNDDLRAKGIRQACLGVGLMIFLGNTAGNIGFGIGALVTAIGIGNLLIARKNS